MIVEPVVLEGSHVRLEPLTLGHLDGLCAVGLDPELWRWTPSAIGSEREMRDYVCAAVQDQRSGRALPFATVDRSSGTVVGSTRFGAIEPAHRRLEIGWTWIARPWQRSAINTEAKLLMLRHAFDVLGCIRVELKTDALNERSRAAILRIGAQHEGILRRHIITASGRVRDTVYYSIVAEEWPSVRERLEHRLGG